MSLNFVFTDFNSPGIETMRRDQPTWIACVSFGWPFYVETKRAKLSWLPNPEQSAEMH